jgi:hypothetical protein
VNTAVRRYIPSPMFIMLAERTLMTTPMNILGAYLLSYQALPKHPSPPEPHIKLKVMKIFNGTFL